MARENESGTRHTPGPWYGVPADIRRDENGRFRQPGEYRISAGSPDGQDDRYYRIASVSNANDSPENSANARLMTAAPELLAALVHAVERYGKPGGPWNVPGEPGTWISEARAAILKATGEAA